MAKGNRVYMTLYSETGNRAVYHTTRSKNIKASELKLRKYNPLTRKHELFKAKDTRKGNAK